jgi:hypothetical protein
MDYFVLLLPKPQFLLHFHAHLQHERALSFIQEFQIWQLVVIRAGIGR